MASPQPESGPSANLACAKKAACLPTTPLRTLALSYYQFIERGKYQMGMSIGSATEWDRLIAEGCMEADKIGFSRER